MYQNHLYVYPQMLNFTSRSATSKARTIACRVQVYASDDLSAGPLLCLYGRHGTLVDSLTTAVTYHMRTPAFYEEIKVELPAHLTPKHHVLFSFYHISCQPPKKGETKERIETPVGFAFLSLIDANGCIVESPREPLPVSANLVPGYLTAELKWIDNRKPLFKVATVLGATVRTQDPRLSHFLILSQQPTAMTATDPRETEELRGSISSVPDTRPELIVQFMHPLLNNVRTEAAVGGGRDRGCACGAPRLTRQLGRPARGRACVDRRRLVATAAVRPVGRRLSGVLYGLGAHRGLHPGANARHRCASNAPCSAIGAVRVLLTHTGTSAGQIARWRCMRTCSTHWTP